MAQGGHYTGKAWKAREDKKLSDVCGYAVQQKHDLLHRIGIWFILSTKK